MPSCVGDICRPEAAIELKLCTERLSTDAKVTINIIIYFRPHVYCSSTLCAIFSNEYSLVHRDFPPGNWQTNDFINDRYALTQKLSISAWTKPELWIEIMLSYLIKNNENLTQGFEVNLRNRPRAECVFRLHWGNSNIGKECWYVRCKFAIILNKKSNWRSLQIVKGLWRAEYRRRCLSRAFIHFNSAEIIE